MTAQLSNSQAKAVDDTVAWFRGGKSTPQVFRLFGYAGTGKTFTARHVESLLDVSTAYCAYTGKAASVLGNGASTIHRLIYRVKKGDQAVIDSLKKQMETASPSLLGVLKRDLAQASKPVFVLKDVEEVPYDLIVCDEVSMVGEKIGQDLLSFGKKILVLGDPGQLPPVEGSGFFDTAKPDILLTEIHRQARDNPIISMATLVRQGHRLRKGVYGTSRVIDRRTESVDPREFDQLIVGTNRSRRTWNARYRELAGWSAGCPEQGEKVICLRNNHEKGILNGTQWRVRNGEDKGLWYTLDIEDWDEQPFTGMSADNEDALILDCHPFNVDLKEEPDWIRRKYEEFDFGYAITCHKAQGSGWPKVYIADESFIFKENATRWLYTAITRASETVLVAQ
jgi:exodeoxyribonuclease-5